jgi:predicted  nucleic acid-binding Zn-ribbon protein
MLRSGKVKTNKEYDSLAKEIQDAKDKIEENEKSLKEKYSERKSILENEISLIQKELQELEAELTENKNELDELSKMTEDEENELKSRRESLISQIIPEDLEFYQTINNVKFGEAVAVVRKGSCLGCYNSIPPQKAIEIKMAQKFYFCESCGRILISEELINNMQQ